MKKFNFRKISAIAGSLLLTGMSLGVASAAAYPAPFVSGGTANVAIVYGTGSGVSSLDLIQAFNIQTDLQSNIQTDLQSYMGSTSGGTDTSVDGEAVSLESGSTKIWLNTSLNTAITTITKSDLPTVLAQTTFSGNVDSKITSTITVGSSNKVTFDKQPSSNDDPVIGIALNTNAGAPLYNASISMPAIAFNSTDSEGETITLFGKDYVVSTATDDTSLILFSSAETITLSTGGSNPVPSKTVTVNGNEYTVELVSASDTTAWVSVNGESKEITEGQSKKVGGIDIAVKVADESTALSTATATLLVGSDKLTFSDGTQVTKGSDDDPIDGTYVTFTGSTGALTGLDVAVYAPDSSNDAILEGETFTDPVFGSFKVEFSGLNIPFDSTDRETIKIEKSGDRGMALYMVDSDGNEKTFDFAYNASTTFLGDSNSYRIAVRENATLYQNNYTMVGNEDYGHLLQLTRIYNNTGTDYSKDAVSFKDVISGDTYEMDATAEGTGRLTIDGRQYTVTYVGSGDTGTVQLKYPTSDSSAGEYVVFPTIKTNKGALVSLYEPQTIVLRGETYGLTLPDGDGYTDITITNKGLVNDAQGGWIIDGRPVNATVTGANGTYFTVGQLTYHINGTGAVNTTSLKLVNPSTGAEISAPGVVLIEGKDDSSNYEAIVIDLEANAAGTSSDPVGVNDVYFTSPTLYEKTMQSDSDVVENVDWYGTMVSEDSNTASQKVVTISYPKNQVYANVFIGEESASITSSGSSGSSSLGEVLVTDAEVSSVATKNLIVVGGSCINSAAATLVGGAYCGAAWTEATGVGTGQFLIKGYSGSTLTSKLALLVAGYEAADTANAKTYLTTKKPDTASAWIGTSSTEATLQTEAA